VTDPVRRTARKLRSWVSVIAMLPAAARLLGES
jgi:hypothetical protein